MLKTNNNKAGILKMHSKFSPAGIIGLEVSKSTIILGLRLGDTPNSFVDVLLGFKIRWTETHANKEVRIHISVQETPQVRYTFEGNQHEVDDRLFDINKIMICPVAFKRLRFTTAELRPPRSSSVDSFI